MDDLIKNGTLKESKVGENFNLEKNISTLGGEGILILILQSIVVYYSFISVINLAWAGSSGRSFTFFLLFFLVGIFQFFIIRFLMKKKGGFAAFLLGLGIIASLFIGSILVAESQLLIHEYIFQSKAASESKSAQIVYLDALKEFETPQLVVGAEDNYLLTDKNRRITLEENDRDGVTTEQLKTLVGKKIEIKMENFISGVYPVYKYIGEWYFQSHIYLNNKLINKSFFD